MDRYRPPHEELWEGRDDEGDRQRLHQVVQLIDLNNTVAPFTGKPFALIGFACDEGVKRNRGRIGAAEGPQSIRLALAKMPLSSPQAALVDAGNIICADNDLEKAQDALAEAIACLTALGCRPLVLGGGHELAWGHYQGIKKCGQHENLSIINIDAHYDLRPLDQGALGTSGTSFLQIAHDRESEGLPFNYACIGVQPASNTLALAEEAQRLNVATITAEAFHRGGSDAVLPHFMQLLEGSPSIMLSVCMDVFAAPYAPGVSAPNPSGLLPWHVIPLVRAVKASGRLHSVEIAEVAPPYDHDALTARLAALLIHEFLEGDL